MSSNIFERACLVRLKSEKVAACASSASALLLDSKQGYVLTHASILLPFLEDDGQLGKHILDGIRGGVSTFGLKSFKSVGVHVTLAKDTIVEGKTDIPSRKKYHIKTHAYSPSVVSTNTLDAGSNLFPGCISSMFKCSNFSKALQPLLKDSTSRISSKRRKEKQDEDIARNVQVLSCLLPYFILIQLEHWRPYSNPLSLRPAGACCIGERIQVCGTPFGDLTPGVFFNSISEGVISAIAGKTKSLLVTDVRSVPGSEGGPAYTFMGPGKYLTGLVASSLCWSGNEWVSYCLVCSVDEIIGNLPTSLSLLNQFDGNFENSAVAAASGSVQRNLLREKNSTASVEPDQANADAVCHQDEAADKSTCQIATSKRVSEGVPPAVLSSVVCVNNGSVWGSGVVIGSKKKLILTCSHVVKDHQHQVTVTLNPCQTPSAARVLYHCDPPVPFDLALLSCASLTPKQSLTVDSEMPKEGSRVFIVGFGVFREELSSGPLVSAGVIAKVVKVNSMPVMIQTTGAVHSGCSGGALVSREGKLMGIVVCNIKDMDSGVSFPHINLSIPILAAWPVLEEYISSGDTSYLKQLQLTSPLVRKLWTLSEGSKVSGERNPFLSKL